jgi:predicted Fe-S protein YdhL (DUF1289 family)
VPLQGVPAVPVKLTSSVESPCINVCTLSDNVCLGCYRTGDEIVEWLHATDDRKIEILERIANE